MADSFLWHEVSEEESEKIKKQAKSIMDSFAKKLEKIDVKMAEPTIERDICEREEGEGTCCDEDFRQRIFENAPEKKGDFIVAEKGAWK